MKPSDMWKLISDEIRPSKMSPKQALDWLEELSTDIEGQIDALRSEIGDDG